MRKEKVALEWFYFLGYMILANLVAVIATGLPWLSWPFVLFNPEASLFLTIIYFIVRMTIWSFQTLRASESQPLLIRFWESLLVKLKAARPMSRQD